MGKLGKFIAAAAVVAGAASVLGRSFTKAGTYEHGQDYLAGDVTVAEQITKIDMDYSAGNVRVLGGDIDSIEVKEIADQEIPDDLKVHTWVNEGTLYIKSYASGADIRKANVRKELTITVPENIELNEGKFTLSAGDLEYREVDAGRVSLYLSAGNLVCEDVEAGTLEVKISAGNVNANNISGKQFTIKTSAGNQVVNGAMVDVFAGKASAGKISVSFTAEPKTASIKASAGDVVVALPEDADIKVKVSASAGDVRCEVPARKEKETYVIGAGSDSMEITASAGDVTIRNN